MQQPCVTVNLKCDRTGKTTPVEVAIEGAAALMNAVTKKQAMAENLRSELAKLDSASLPDLVICFRGKVVVLPYINAENDVVICRSLAAAIHREDVFTYDPAQVKRKPRKVVKEDAPTPLANKPAK